MSQKVFSKKISIPKFEANGKNVSLEDLINVDKYIALINSISMAEKNGEITEYEAKFLKLSASRWIKFNYSNIAQYYITKANPKMQQLMEESALILIDVDKAFEKITSRAYKFIKGITTSDSETNINEFLEEEPQ